MGNLDFFKAIVDTIRLPILILGKTLKVEAANRAFFRVFQASSEQTLGQYVLGLGNGQWDIPQLRTLIEAVLATDSAFEDFHVEHDFPSIGRKIMKLNARRLIQPNAENVFILLCIEDVTDAKKAESYRKLFETSNDGIVVLDIASGRITDSNSILSKMLGFPQEEMLGKELWEVGLFESRKAGQSFFERILADGQNSNRNLQVTSRDGRSVDIELACNTYSIGDGELVQCNARDITGRVRAEKAFRLSEEKLRQSHKMAAIGRLAGGIAHDFNNLLTSINGFCALSLSLVDRADTLHKYLNEILASGERASELTRKLLAYSRQLVLTPKVVDLNSLISNSKVALNSLIRENTPLVFDLDPKVGMVKVDPGQIEQILIDLVKNARDAVSGHQSGTIVIATQNVELDEEYGKSHPLVFPGPYVQLRVTDSGIGMDELVRSRIFEPFFTTKAFGRASGLGLSMVHGIVTQCEGYIFVYSEPQMGSTFKIYFPRFVDGKPAGTATAPDHPSRRRKGPETVLVVDNDEAVIRYTRKILETHGYEVLHAFDGLSALSLSKERKDGIHLLITDIVMPGINGPDLAKKFVAGNPGCKVLFMSGFGDSAFLQHGLVGPQSNMIPKPFVPKDLAMAVSEVLDHGTIRRPTLY